MQIVELIYKGLKITVTGNYEGKISPTDTETFDIETIEHNGNDITEIAEHWIDLSDLENEVLITFKY